MKSKIIVASHQPNFIPYQPFFFKMYLSDVFTISNTVSFSNSDGVHNYNYLVLESKKQKITVPIASHSGRIQNIKLAQNFKPQKLLRTVFQNYSKARHFHEVYPEFEKIMMTPFETMWELNFALIKWVHERLGFTCKLVVEETIEGMPEDPNDAIIHIVKSQGGNVYLSGMGGKNYLNSQKFDYANIQLDFVPVIEDIPNPAFSFFNLSFLDYLMHYGFVIPERWKQWKK